MPDTNMINAFDAVNSICGDLPCTAEDRYYETLDSISIAVVDYRVSHNLSQKQLADHLGISQAMVSKYESGDYNISLRALIDLFDKLSIPLNISFGKEPHPRNTGADLLLRSGYKKVRPEADPTEPHDKTPGSAA